jgi:hypothetical protein
MSGDSDRPRVRNYLLRQCDLRAVSCRLQAIGIASGTHRSTLITHRLSLITFRVNPTIL